MKYQQTEKGVIMAQAVFKRVEKKYLLNQEQYKELTKLLQNHMIMDQYGKHTICNTYFDTENYQLIRASIEKPLYKEKLRLRSYGVPKESSKVFLELKKKFKGVVYKRRQEMTYDQAFLYLYYGVHPASSQILKEIDWFLTFYNPASKVNISYDRFAFYHKEDENLRITFDNNILCRDYALDLKKGVWGKPLLRENQYLMEIKIPGAIPIWLNNELTELEIFSTSFSKYGSWYKNYYLQNERNGGAQCV